MTITCPRCRTDNPEAAKFCHNCGFAFAAAGSAGVQQVAPVRPQERLQQYIPPQLLAKLEAVRSGSGRVAAERRVVTVLFCDVQGSTTLAEQLDPEEWAEIINGAFMHLIAPIYRYEGTLARLMGDAILAFFGAPIAHEDDPERAVRAALEIVEGIRGYRDEVRRRWGLDFDVRVGINTGLVVVGEVGSDLRVEYTALGDAVNLAARMEQSAAPSTVQIAEATYKAIENAFEVEPLGAIEVKGKAEPVPTYRVLRALPGAAAARQLEGLSSPLVGRAQDLNRLQQSVNELLAGQGHIVVVLGDAGLGKSRLVAELRRWVRAEGLLDVEGPPDTPRATLQWHEGRARSYDTMTPYAPFVALFADWFGLMPNEGDAAKYAQISQRVAAAAPDRIAEIAPYLATLLGVTVPAEDVDRVRFLEPEQLREWIFSAVESFLASVARAQPLVLVFEDLHWADPTSLALLERLMSLTDELPLMLLAAFRPLRQEASWRFHEMAARDYPHRYTLIQLEPLDDEEARELVSNLLNVQGLSEDEQRKILEKTDGNPFYIEEVIRALLDAGAIVRANAHWVATRMIDAISIPDTVIGVLTARLDRLDDETRRVAQMAAVIGREFSFAVLARVSAELGESDDLDRVLRELQRRELIRERGRFPERTYRFKHVLTQEAAYASLLLSRRRELHGRVAEALEAVFPEQREELRPVLAHHYARAERWAAALEQAERAGAAAQAAFANQEALELYQQALAAADRLGADTGVHIRLHRARGWIYDTLGNFDAARADYEAAVELARDVKDMRAEWQGLLDLGLLWASRDYAQTGAYYRQALTLARATDDPAVLARSLNHLGNWYLNVEEPEAALRNHEEALAIFAAVGDRQGLAETHDLLGMTNMFRTDLTRGLDHYQRASELFAGLDDRRAMAQSKLVMALYSGYYEIEGPPLDPAGLVAALRNAEQALELARQIGWRAQESFVLITLSQIYGWRGSYARALELIEQGRSIAEQIGHRQWLCFALCARGVLLLDVLALPEARQDLEASLRLAQETGSAYWMRVTASGLILECVEEGDLAAAARVLEDVPDPDGPVQSLAHWLVRAARAQFALGRGEAAEALRLVESLALPVVEGAGSINPLRVAKLRGEALSALGRTAEAEAALLEARDGFEARELPPPLWRMHALLGRFFESIGRTEEAERERQAARAIVRELALGITDEELRENYLRRAEAVLSGQPQ